MYPQCANKVLGLRILFENIRLFLCDCFQQCISSKPLNQHARNAHTEILHCQKEITAQCPFKGRTDNLIGEDYTSNANKEIFLA